MPNLKQRTITGLKWSAIERFSAQGISFVISIIIARILSPADYGVIGMITIFIGVSYVFINSGFGSALIQNQSRNEKDFSTVFWYSLVASFFFYLLLFFAAPWIAMFFKTPILLPITRVVGLNIIIGSLSIIHSTKLTIAIDFKTQTKISLIAVFITGILGIVMAYQGFGVWALVCQGLAASFITTISLWLYIRWKPRWIFSFESFKELFGYGSKLMLSGLLDTIYSNIYQLVIGKKYNATDLGYYSRALGLVQLPSITLTGVIQRVTFPVLCEIQHDSQRLTENYRRLLKMTAFIIFPIMAFLVALGEPLVRVLLTDKWLPTVPYMQVLSISYMFYPIHAINLNLLAVKGRSDLFLRLEIIKKIMITLVLFVSVPFGILVMCYGSIITSVIGLAINTYYTGTLIQYGFLKQINDLKKSVLVALLAGVAAFLPSMYFTNLLLQLLVGGTIGAIMLIGCALLLKMEELSEIRLTILSK